MLKHVHDVPARQRVYSLQLSVCQRFLHSLALWRLAENFEMEEAALLCKQRRKHTSAQNTDVCARAVQVCFLFFISRRR